MSLLEVAARHPVTWKRVCWTIIVLLLPWLFANVIDGRSWVTIGWWVISLAFIWFRPATKWMKT